MSVIGRQRIAIGSRHAMKARRRRERHSSSSAAFWRDAGEITLITCDRSNGRDEVTTACNRRRRDHVVTGESVTVTEPPLYRYCDSAA